MNDAAAPMRLIWTSIGVIERAYQQLERVPYAVLAVPLRVAIATVFWNSGMTKLADWNATIALFTDEYQVPLLPPELAANLALAIELTRIHASWCPTCKAQDPILSELMSAPKFKDLVYFLVDFDRQKDAVKFLGARMQSTLIAFKGEKVTGRSVGDTDRSSIAALLSKTL